MAQHLDVRVEFTGGLEILFANQRKHQIHIPDKDAKGQAFNVSCLIKWLCQHVMTDPRKEMFVLEDGQIRPGILVLINDADWELEGREEVEIQDGDEVVFVSTLHGG